MSRISRVFAISDLHVDYIDNMQWLNNLSRTAYRDDVLIVAGDISDDPVRLRSTFEILAKLFARIFFVPGNHDVWIRRKECDDSLEKFRLLRSLCKALNVRMEPERVVTGPDPDNAVWVVPLYSWYVTGEEGEGTLYVPRTDGDADLGMWRDRYHVHWPALDGGVHIADHFIALNEDRVNRDYDAPVISFSHFLPRQDIMFADKGASTVKAKSSFNFSSVAGHTKIEAQIRKLDSRVHIYGHQHRNRQRLIGGILYVSHCLGYPQERRENRIGGIGDTPIRVWPLPAA